MIFIRLKGYGFPIAIFLVSRVSMWIGLFLALDIFQGSQSFGAAFYQIWIHWDASWYLSVVTRGYYYIPNAESSSVFFPLLPILVRLGTFVTDPVTAGMLIANLCTVFGYVLLYALVRLEFPNDEGIAKRTILYIAFFPTAIFSSLIFTEGLLLLLTVAAIYFARRRLWSLSIAAAILACATHANGVLLVIPVALEWVRSHGLTLTTVFRREAWRSLFSGLRAEPLTVLAILLIPLGLISFMYYEYVTFGNLLLFFQAQSQWGRLVGGLFASTTQQISRVFSGIVSGQYVSLEQLFNVAGFVLALPLSLVVWRKLGTTYGLFTLANIVIPVATGLTSFARFTSILFPLFIVLALWGKHSAVHQVILTFFCVILGVVIVVYANNIFIG
ncbi:MAG TPA: hypothetical protein VHD90_12475 [Phototrophicaceae bacterium]|nr:hypothetical protein [Phototrophicaceae bacterium]